jgi:hypothetical protein
MRQTLAAFVGFNHQQGRLPATIPKAGNRGGHRGTMDRFATRSSFGNPE